MDISSFQSSWDYPSLNGRGEEAEILFRAGLIPTVPSKQLSEGSPHILWALGTSPLRLLQPQPSLRLVILCGVPHFPTQQFFDPPWCKTSQWIPFPPSPVLCPGFAGSTSGPGLSRDAKRCSSLSSGSLQLVLLMAALELLSASSMGEKKPLV